MAKRTIKPATTVHATADSGKKPAANSQKPIFKTGTPPPVKRGGRNSKFGLENMKPGQYLDVEKKSLNTVLSWARRRGLKFVSRTTDNTPAGMISVYYTESK